MGGLRGAGRYNLGGIIGKVIVDGADCNLEQIKSGLAWHYKQYQREQSTADRDLYAEAEQVARQGHVGLWSEGEPVTPWEFRHNRKRY